MRGGLAALQAFGTSMELSHLRLFLKTALNNCEHRHRWCGRNERDNIGIGFYNNEAEYFTQLLHEAGHNVLWQHQPDVSNYESKRKEEEFCWRFSFSLCKALGLPFDQFLADIGLEWADLHINESNLPEPDFIQIYEDLVEKERRSRNFSDDEDARLFIFNEDGVPIKREQYL